MCIVFVEPQNRFSSEMRIYEKQTVPKLCSHTTIQKNTNQSQTILGNVYEPTYMSNL